ncbi:hypothetical protein EDB86DRAFT_2895656 [Lactarius hatsudake]|nr:hypothetical protein EDB86DRAFT_2895656 [Lactarius hatsudake]
MEIWFLLIDHNFQAIGSPFLVDSTGVVFIYHLMEKVKEERLGAFSRIEPFQLTVWRCMDPTTSFDDEDLEKFRRQVSEVLSNKRVEQFSGMEAIGELNISKNEILFVSLPGQPVVTSDQVGDSQVVREYEHCFLYADSKGGFTEDDIEYNDIKDPDVNDRDAPEFVKKYKQMLGRKRKVADNLKG